MSRLVVFNGTAGPVLIDAEGRVIGSGWHAVTRTPEVREALLDFRLVEVEKPSATEGLDRWPRRGSPPR